MNHPIYRAGLRTNSKGRLILILEYDVNDLGNDIKAVLADRQRLIDENVDLKSRIPVGEALAIDADDKEQLARLHAAAASITSPTE